MSFSTAKKRNANVLPNVLHMAMYKRLATSGIDNVLVAYSGGSNRVGQVFFNRQELNLMLRLYSLQVAKGEWRDYAIDCLADRAIFSIFRHSHQRVLFSIIKNPKLQNRQGMYSVANHQGRVLKRGSKLENVLQVLQTKKLKVIK